MDILAPFREAGLECADLIYGINGAQFGDDRKGEGCCRWWTNIADHPAKPGLAAVAAAAAAYGKHADGGGGRGGGGRGSGMVTRGDDGGGGPAAAPPGYGGAKENGGATAATKKLVRAHDFFIFFFGRPTVHDEGSFLNHTAVLLCSQVLLSLGSLPQPPPRPFHPLLGASKLCGTLSGSFPLAPTLFSTPPSFRI